MGAEERRSEGERREERENVNEERGKGEKNRENGGKVVRVASRTICPGWPHREVGRSLRGVGLVQQGETRKRNRGKEESGVEGEHRGKRDEKGKTITN